MTVVIACQKTVKGVEVSLALTGGHGVNAI